MDRNSHEVSKQFEDDHLDLRMGGLAKDMCEDGMRHLCLNSFTAIQGRAGTKNLSPVGFLRRN
jgi:hypothetical protein